ncbi:MAG: hypothetical protein AB1589_07275 [Cyanobacteriota bacterium]
MLDAISFGIATRRCGNGYAERERYANASRTSEDERMRSLCVTCNAT